MEITEWIFRVSHWTEAKEIRDTHRNDSGYIINDCRNVNSWAGFLWMNSNFSSQSNEQNTNTHTHIHREETRISSKRREIFHYCYNLWSTIAIIWDRHTFNGYIIFIHFLTAMTLFNETPIFIDYFENSCSEEKKIKGILRPLRLCCCKQSKIDLYQKEFGRHMQIHSSHLENAHAISKLQRNV